MRRIWRVLAMGFICAAIEAARAEDAPPAAIAIEPVKLDHPVDFTADILPILKQSCIACHHGKDAEAGLVLEDPRSILTGGDSGPAINLEKPDQSLILRSAARVEKPFMPPKKNKVDAPPLTPHQLGLLRLWIEQGAKGPLRATRPEPQFQGPPPGWHPIFAAALSPDGLYAAAGRANEIHIYHLGTRKLVARLVDPNLKDAADRDAIQSLAFSSDGSLLASGGYRDIKLWRRTLPEKRFKVPVPPAAPVQAAQGIVVTNPGAKLLAAKADLRMFSVTNIETGQVVAKIATDVQAKRELQRAQDATELTHRELNLYTAQVAQFTQEVTNITNALNQAKAAAQTAEQDAAAKKAAVDAAAAEVAAMDKALAEAGQLIKQQEEKVKASADAITAAGQIDPASEQAVKLANDKKAADEALKQAQSGQAEKKKQAEATAAKKGEADKALTTATKVKQEADANVNAQQAALQQPQQHLGIAQAAKDKATQANQQAEARVQQTTAGFNEAKPYITSAAIRPDGSALVLGSDDGNVLFAPIASEGRAVSLKLHNAPVIALSFNDKGEMLSIAADGDARLGSLDATWTLERTIQPADSSAPPLDRVTALAFSPDGKTLVSGGGIPSREGELLVWNVADPGAPGLVRKIDNAHSDTVLDIAFGPDGSLIATGGADKFAKVFNPATAQLVRSFEGHTNHVLAVGWNRSGHYLATGSADKVVKVWNTHDGSQLRTIDGFDKQVTRLLYLGPREEFATAWGSGHVQLVHENGTRGRSFEAGQDYIYALATTPDAQLLAAGGQDGVLRVWETQSGQVVGVFEVPK